MKRVLLYLLLVAVVAAGVYFRVITFDPLSLVILALLLWTQFVAVNQRQQLADLIIKSSDLTQQNQKVLASKIEDVRAEVRRLRQ